MKNEFDEKAARLTRETAGITAPARLTSAVMAALDEPAPTLFDSLRRVGTYAVALAALSAAASLAFSIAIEDSVDEDTLATFPVVDTEE